MRRRAPRYEPDSDDDAYYADDLGRPDVLSERSHPKHQQQQQTDGERSLHDNERRGRERKYLRTDADDPKHQPENPARTAQKSSQQGQTETEGRGGCTSLESLERNADVEQHRCQEC